MPRRQLEHSHHLALRTLLQAGLLSHHPLCSSRLWLDKGRMGDERRRAIPQASPTNRRRHLYRPARHLRFPKCLRACRRRPPLWQQQHRPLPRAVEQRHLLYPCRPRKPYQHRDNRAIPRRDDQDHLRWAHNPKTAVPLRQIFCIIIATAEARCSTCLRLRQTMKARSITPCFEYSDADKAQGDYLRLLLTLDLLSGHWMS